MNKPISNEKFDGYLRVIDRVTSEILRRSGPPLILPGQLPYGMVYPIPQKKDTALTRQIAKKLPPIL